MRQLHPPLHSVWTEANIEYLPDIGAPVRQRASRDLVFPLMLARSIDANIIWPCRDPPPSTPGLFLYQNSSSVPGRVYRLALSYEIYPLSLRYIFTYVPASACLRR